MEGFPVFVATKTMQDVGEAVVPGSHVTSVPMYCIYVDIIWNMQVNISVVCTFERCQLFMFWSLSQSCVGGPCVDRI